MRAKQGLLPGADRVGGLLRAVQCGNSHAHAESLLSEQYGYEAGSSVKGICFCGDADRQMSCCVLADYLSYVGNPGVSLPPAAELRAVTSVWTPLPSLPREAACRPWHAGRPCARGGTVGLGVRICLPHARSDLTHSLTGWGAFK